MGDKPIPSSPLLLLEIDDGLGGGCWDEEDQSSESYLALPRERRQHPEDAPTIAEDNARLLLLLQELRRQVGGKKGVSGGLGSGGILSLGYANVAVGGGRGGGQGLAGGGTRQAVEAWDVGPPSRRGHWAAQVVGDIARPTTDGKTGLGGA
jgi:hypothetical protein